MNNTEEVVSKAFEFSFTTGVLTLMLIAVSWASYIMIKRLYNDNKQLTKDVIEVSSAALSAIDKVAETKSLSGKALEAINNLRLEINNISCKWISK